MNTTLRVLAVMAAVAIVATAATVSLPPAHAQRIDDSLPPLADLSIISEHTRSATENWQVIVKNNTVGAHPGTEVRLVKVSIVVTNAEGASSTTWTIKDLPAGESVMRVVHPPLFMGVTEQRLYAEIIETDPAEPPGFEFNNATEHWVLGNVYTNGDMAVAVGISDRIPPAGGTTTFTVLATNFSDGPFPGALEASYADNQLEVQVEISLSEGLTFAGTAPAPSGTTFDSNTGIWDIGTLVDVVGFDQLILSLPVAVNLTAESLADLPLQERCLTATVVRAVPWFEFVPSKRENDTVTVCLGRDPPALLTGGELVLRNNEMVVNGAELVLIDFYPCVGVTSHPCASADTLELVAEAHRAKIDLPGLDRVDAFDKPHRGTTYLQPETVIMRVWNHRQLHGGAMIKDGADKPSWSTADMFILIDSQKRLPDTVWSTAREDLTVTGPDGGPLPGYFAMDITDVGVIKITNTTKVVGESFDTGYDADFALEFGSLGTYVLTLDIRATHNQGTVATDDDVTHTDSGRYTFHVGPVADLGLRDAGASPGVAPDQRAYTLMAVNNGFDDAPAVQATLTGVPEGAEIAPSEGNYAEGACQNNVCTGTWNIGKLSAKNIRRATGQTEGPTLTIVSNGDPITATIKNTRKYTACIGSKLEDIAAADEAACTGNTGASWHTAAYYDYVDGNNTATVTARAGTGAGHPDAPRSLETMATSLGNVLTWQPVARVNGLAVTHYEVQRSASSWQTLPNNPKGTMYLDKTAGSGNMAYRVRAVNIFGVPGPWSHPSAQGPAVPGNFTVAALGDTAIQLSWSRPYGRKVAHYEVEYSEDGGDSWSFLARVTVTDDASYSYTDSGLTLNTTRHYRVRGVAMAGGAEFPGAWSVVRSAVAGASIAPYVVGAGISSSPAAGDTYQLGESIAIEVIFSEAIRVQGSPTLSLDIGSVVKRVAMTSHAGDTLTFRYTVVQGDQDTVDGVSVPRNGLTLPVEASITDAQGDEALLAFPGLDDQPGHKVRTVGDPSVPPAPPPPFHAEPPPAPEALSATPGDEQVTLEWSPYCCDQRRNIYQLWRGDHATWADIPGSSRDTGSHTFTGLVNDTTYRFQLRAVYIDGQGNRHPGAASHVVVATPHVPDPNRGPNNPPEFELPANESFSVVERAPLGTRVATVRATDPDGDRLTYTLSGEHHSRFSIANVNGAGVITVAEAELSIPWSENNTAFSLGVEVTDGRGGRDHRAVVVALEPSPLRDNPPVVEEPSGVSIACGAGAGTELVTLRADDPEGDALRFMLVDGDLDGEGGYFEFKHGTTGDHGDFWGDTHGLLVDDGSDAQAVLQVAKTFPEDLCGGSYGIIVEVEEADNPGNNHTLQFGFRIEPKSTTHRRDGEGQGYGTLYAALSEWVSEAGAGIRSLFDAVARLPANFYRNLETAGAGLNSSPRSAAVWDWWPYRGRVE